MENTSPYNWRAALDFDKKHLWHPYTSIENALPTYPIESAEGVYLKMADGRNLIDGMSSWWSTIHGYNHPELNKALVTQTQKMAHVMFGGITHKPAIELARILVDISPAPLQKVFLADSGSISVEVAIKMALQYWHALQKPEKNKVATIKSGYHGDTFKAMSVCDPVNGMHHIFKGAFPINYFAEAPQTPFGEPLRSGEMDSLKQILEHHGHEIACLILEPIVQGAGGMRFYSASYLKEARNLCDKYEVLLIADEIATAFGKTGKMFAVEHADICPDIMCVGKALSGGYMTLAATLTTTRVSEVISSGNPGVFMHGPTFMGNPLACAVAVSSLKLLLESNWQQQINDLQNQLSKELAPCAALSSVADVRVLGNIGVLEMHAPMQVAKVQKQLVDLGVWIRPFGKLFYVIVPFVISSAELTQLTNAMHIVAKQIK